MFAIQTLQIAAGVALDVAAMPPNRRLEDRLSQGSIRRVETKEDIYCEGEARTHVFQVVQGVVAIYTTLVDGRRQIIDFGYPGDIIGLGVLNEHVLSARAVSPVKVRCLSASALERAAEADASLAIKLYRAVSQELAVTRHLLVTLGQRSAIERLATFLLDLHRRFGEPEDGNVTLAMLRSDIGDFLGLTIETVSRTLKKLRATGIIELEQGGTIVHIRDLERLKELARE